MSYRHPRVPDFNRLPNWVSYLIWAIIIANVVAYIYRKLF